ncbi:PREDICTED: collagen alpha-1(IV) chain-like, partial [Rhagoletis zephyria]|uniref:collagen alpha-1(IV) chain-like n=1 Tax=Rhagoletis zephyria TaxID=28612 RepID=UPI000811803E
DIGDMGAMGLPGYPGPKGGRGGVGDRGIRGLDGFNGLQGVKGDRGIRGLDGFNGLQGVKGVSGEDGLIGRSGLPGQAGERGDSGEKGPVGKERPSIGYFFTNQSVNDPICPNNTSKMWSGYSLLYIMGNERAHGQDLGSPGSCLQRFSAMPYMHCNLNNVCQFASRNDYSYWLSTEQPMPASMKPIEGESIRYYISRCSVCESSTQVIAMHSQNTDIPDCPEGWDGLWTGYSFFMNTDAGAEGSGQPLSSPGSCLEQFRANPFIECQGHGRCNYYTTAYSFWLASVDHADQFKVPDPVVLKSENLMKLISRCQVCIRRK